MQVTKLEEQPAHDLCFHCKILVKSATTSPQLCSCVRSVDFVTESFAKLIAFVATVSKGAKLHGVLQQWATRTQ